MSETDYKWYEIYLIIFPSYPQVDYKWYEIYLDYFFILPTGLKELLIVISVLNKKNYLQQMTWPCKKFKGSNSDFW